MLERSEASLPGRAPRLLVSLKSRTTAVATDTLEQEYQAAVTPSAAEGSKALGPQSSGTQPDPLNRCHLVGQHVGRWRRDQQSLLRRTT